MNAVIGNLGEALDFSERYEDDEDDAEAEESTRQPNEAGTSWTTGVADAESASPSSSNNSVDADVVNMSGINLSWYVSWLLVLKSGILTHWEDTRFGFLGMSRTHAL